MLSGIIGALHIGKVSPTIPTLQSNLDLSLTGAGFLISLMQLAGMIGGFAIGIVSDRFGSKRSILVGQTILCVCGLLGAVVLTPSYLYWLRAVESLGLLLVVLPSPGIIRSLVPTERISFAMGMWGCYVSIGTALAFVAAPLVIINLGWRVWWAMPALASAVAVYLVYKHAPIDRKKTYPSTTASEKSTLYKSDKSLRPFLLIGVAFAMYAGQWIAVIGFLPAIYEKFGVNPIIAGTLSATAAATNVIGSVTSAVALHRSIRPIRLLTIGFMGMTGMILIAFSSLTASLVSLQYIAILSFSAIGGLVPGCLFYLISIATRDSCKGATAYGMVQQITCAGMFILPPLLARISDFVGGWQWTWVFSAAASSIAVVCIYRLSARMRVD